MPLHFRMLGKLGVNKLTPLEEEVFLIEVLTAVVVVTVVTIAVVIPAITVMPIEGHEVQALL